MTTEQIEPGLYSEMPEEQYRQAKCASQSLLKMGMKSWKQARHQMLNPKKPSTAMILGTRQHTAMLQPEKMDEWIAQPATYPAPADHAKVKGTRTKPPTMKEGDPLPWNNNANYCEEWYRGMVGKIVLSADDLESIKGMTDAAWANPDAAALLKLKSHKEASAFALDDETGMMIKARFDILPEEPFIVDIKKVQSARAFDWERACAYMGYHIQAAFYGDIRHRILGTPTTAFFFIVIEAEAPYECVVYQIGDASIEKGRKDYLRLLHEYKACKEDDIWPGYFSGVRQFDIPRWAMEDKPIQDELTYEIH